jgi:flagellar biosynthesis protein FliR
VVEPLADVDVKLPGAMAMVVAPVVDQLSVVLDPDEIVVGFAVKELIAGLLAGFTVIVTVDVAEPAELIAVSV